MGGGDIKSKDDAPHHYPAPLLLPAQHADVPDLVRVYINAEKTSLLYLLSWSSEHEVADKWIQMLHFALDHPQVMIVKAVDPATKEIAAFAMWQFCGYELKDLEVYGAHHSYHFASSDQSGLLGAGGLMFPSSTTSINRGKANPTDGDDKPPEMPTTPLIEYLNAAFEAFVDSWLEHTKFLYTACLVTDPRFQRRGIGTTLMRYGHDRADRDKVPAFLVASPVGHPLYLHLGWKEIGRELDVDLKEWVSGAEGGDRGWGMFKYYYMLRLPLTAAKSRA